MLITQLQFIFDPFIHKNLRYPIPSCMMLIGSDFSGRPPLLLNCAAKGTGYFEWLSNAEGIYIVDTYSRSPFQTIPRWGENEGFAIKQSLLAKYLYALNYRSQASNQMFWIWCASSGLLAWSMEFSIAAEDTKAGWDLNFYMLLEQIYFSCNPGIFMPWWPIMSYKTNVSLFMCTNLSLSSAVGKEKHSRQKMHWSNFSWNPSTGSSITGVGGTRSQGSAWLLTLSIQR